jgi:hypothetical protein
MSNHPLNRPGKNIPVPPDAKEEGVPRPCVDTKQPKVSTKGFREPTANEHAKPCDLIKPATGQEFND